MKILVCIKQVPENETEFVINKEKNWIEDSVDTRYRMNRYDEYAIEEALLIKEKFYDVTIDALSVGSSRVQDVLKRALSLGADKGIHLSDEFNSHLSAYDIAYYISDYIKSCSYDLIFTGVMAEDDMQCLVGPMLSGILNIPCAVGVTQTSLMPSDRKIEATCELEGGMSEIVSLTLPALLTIQSGINKPRYPSLSNMLRAKKQKLLTLSLSDSDNTKYIKEDISLSFPAKSNSCIIINGSSEQKAEQLLVILKNFLK